MQVKTDQWTPLFERLKEKFSPFQRKVFLSRIIGRIQDITQQNFGTTGIDRPQEWPQLKKRYAAEFHDGDTTPTLMLDEEKHTLVNGAVPHLVDSFRAEATENSASLTNESPYADVHQLGLGAVPARPFYPVQGSELTPKTEKEVRDKIDGFFSDNQ
jgi:phage gpG-like protein